jgi:hypothetical protein
MASAMSRARRRRPRSRRTPSTTAATTVKAKAITKAAHSTMVSTEYSRPEPSTKALPVAKSTTSVEGADTRPPTISSTPNTFRPKGVCARPLPMPGSGCKGVC